jgi:hypothetical protein
MVSEKGYQEESEICLVPKIICQNWDFSRARVNNKKPGRFLLKLKEFR